MAGEAARYDGHSQWYDETFSVFHPPIEELAFLRHALGEGKGRVCIDLACGTGLCAALIADAGYRTAGFDISADQLRFARRRIGAVARADARFLPVRDEAVSVVAGMFFHTDVEDFAAVVGYVARCLRPRGRFIYVGLHPCFIGPFVERTNEAMERRLRFVPGYGARGWASRASGDGSGLGGRVGFHHQTLADLLQAFADSGLHIRTVAEFSGGGVVLPRNIGLVAEKGYNRPAEAGGLSANPGYVP